jgi:hypothetical protein
MKKKFSRILGVALSVALLASLFGFAAPAAAQAPSMTWGSMAIPSDTGLVIMNDSDIGDIAVSGDGTIYVINNDDAVHSDDANSVLKSTDGGHSFTACSTITDGQAARFLNAVAVAPDNSEVVLVTDGLDCYLSTDGGSAWTELGTAVAGANEILDVDVSPAIPGALFGRHYVRAVADDTAGVIAQNGAEIIGVDASDWAAITNCTANGDGLAVKFSPSYMGDRRLAVLYTSAAHDTYFDIISQPGKGASEALTVSCDITDITSGDYQDQDGGIAVQSLICGDIALPEDWDPTLTAGQVSYVCVGSESAVGAGVADRGGLVGVSDNVADDDVYRIDADEAIALNGVTSQAVHSIDYDGTIADGTLFLGERGAANVKWTLNPTSSAPTWTSTSKAPTGDDSAAPDENCTVVRVAPNGDIYAGTRDIWQSGGSDERSAFSVSTDAGKTFNQTSLVDVGAPVAAPDDIIATDDFMVTPDGATIFLATNDGSDLSLWKSSTDTGSNTWERVYTRTATGPSIVRIAPDWGDNPSVFWIDTNAGANDLWVSHDGGAIFANRTTPLTGANRHRDLAIESGGTAGVVYLGTSTGDVYKSTNGGDFFGLAEPSMCADVESLSMAPMYPAMPEAGHLIVGGPSEVSYSTDSAESFTLIDSGLTNVGNCVVGADEAYATNNTIYFVGPGANGGAYRFVIGTDTSWIDLSVAEGAVTGTDLTGIALNNGVLYAADETIGEGVYLSIWPLEPPGTLGWERMDSGDCGAATTFDQGAHSAAAGHPNSLVVVNNQAWAVDTAAAVESQLLSFNDYLATEIPVLTAPADSATVLVDPVTGRAELVTLTWASMGSGQGLVDEYDIWITKTTDTEWSAPRTTTITLASPTAPETTVHAQLGDWAISLAANTKYMWRVRAEDEVSNDDIRGQWSESRVLSVQAGGQVLEPQVGPVLQGPLPGATDVSVNPGFSWTPIAGATLYEFILALDAELTLTVEDTPVYVSQPSWQVPPGTLEYDTTYFWGVKAVEPTESPQSIGTFRTMSIDVYECPFCDEEFGSLGALESHIASVHPAATPAYIWAIIVIGAVLMIAVIMLIVKTRRVV